MSDLWKLLEDMRELVEGSFQRRKGAYKGKRTPRPVRSKVHTSRKKLKTDDEVFYRSASADQSRSCKNCVNWVDPEWEIGPGQVIPDLDTMSKEEPPYLPRCMKVLGWIRPDYTCYLFESR